jgi:DNA modification methylase
MTVDVRLGDCLDVMRTMPDDSVHAVVTDPPYGLEFMGKEWDSFGGRRDAGSRGGTGDKGLLPGYGRGGTSADVARFKQRSSRAYQEWCEDWAAECLRVLRPGGYLLAFGGTRTFHRLACAVEDAGFEIRDSIAWLYGSGFPKSLDVGKAIDKAAGAQREVVGVKPGHEGFAGRSTNGHLDRSDGGTHEGWQRPWTEAEDAAEKYHALTAPATSAAREWAGWGTALKPAFEPVVVARKPLAGSVAGNVQEWGTGALNIDACRVSAAPGDYDHPGNDLGHRDDETDWRFHKRQVEPHAAGRWPTNVVLDGSQADALDQQSGERPVSGAARKGADVAAGAAPGEGWGNVGRVGGALHNDSGGASRFFPTFRYQAKAPTTERPTYTTPDGRKVAHPTVKPLGLMRWLVRLVTPPGGVVLDPFAGSGATVEACLIEGFDCIAIERDPESLPLIQIRIDRQADTLPFGEAAG